MSALDDLRNKKVNTQVELCVLYWGDPVSASNENIEQAEHAAADLAALNARVEEMKTDLARCFIELSECGSESFADDMAEKYFDTWQEIQKRAKGAE